MAKSKYPMMCISFAIYLSKNHFYKLTIEQRHDAAVTNGTTMSVNTVNANLGLS